MPRNFKNLGLILLASAGIGASGLAMHISWQERKQVERELTAIGGYKEFRIIRTINQYNEEILKAYPVNEKAWINYKFERHTLSNGEKYLVPIPRTEEEKKEIIDRLNFEF